MPLTNVWRDQVRTVFVIDPKEMIRLTISYPDEILRVIDSLQLGDKHKITTPVNWQKGDHVIVHPGVNDEDAKKLFPKHKKHLVSGYKCSAVAKTPTDSLQPYL